MLSKEDLEKEVDEKNKQILHYENKLKGIGSKNVKKFGLKNNE